MGNPFQDQLLKAGLVNKKQVKKAQHEKRASRKQDKGALPEKATNKAREEQEAQARRNKELNRQRLEEKRQGEQKAQVKQLIEDNRLARDERGEPYNFVEENKIKRIFVAPEMAEQLSRGQLAIVRLAATYEVVPAKVARQIAQRDPEAVAAFHEGSP
ncbi:MAG: DUF2058 domain-containing protein [Desulfurivibrionaceae bacterium]|nr:DUF2058 domain-containing protein [Desulfurivibrionaceae bacterium]